MRSTLVLAASILLAASAIAQDAASKGTKEPYDWAPAMRELTKGFKGKPGMVLRLGDSITYANPGSAYLRYGKGRNAEQLAVCRWMNAGENGKSSGIWLSIADQPGGRSFTAASGVTTAQYLQGGKGGLPKLDDILKEHQPQIACVLLGTNDISANVTAADYAKNMETIVGKLLAAKTIAVLITVPPIQRNPEAAVAFNDRLREIGARHKLPVVDRYHRRDPRRVEAQRLAGHAHQQGRRASLRGRGERPRHRRESREQRLPASRLGDAEQAGRDQEASHRREVMVLEPDAAGKAEWQRRSP